jgi:hypothetical protein
MDAYELDELNRADVLARLDSNTVAELELNESDWVRYGDGEQQFGVITGKIDGPLAWPTGDDSEEMVGDEGETVYVVARMTGGSKPYTEDELDEANRDDIIEDDEYMPDDPAEDLDEAEMSAVYSMMDDTRDLDELYQIAELINVPGVDDPGVGFDDWPPSWEKSEKPARLILLDVWSSVGGSWTGAFQEFGSKRLASAMKDEVLGTERWRGRF